MFSDEWILKIPCWKEHLRFETITSSTSQVLKLPLSSENLGFVSNKSNVFWWMNSEISVLERTPEIWNQPVSHLRFWNYPFFIRKTLDLFWTNLMFSDEWILNFPCWKEHLRFETITSSTSQVLKLPLSSENLGFVSNKSNVFWWMNSEISVLERTPEIWNQPVSHLRFWNYPFFIRKTLDLFWTNLMFSDEWILEFPFWKEHLRFETNQFHIAGFGITVFFYRKTLDLFWTNPMFSDEWILKFPCWKENLRFETNQFHISGFGITFFFKSGKPWICFEQI